VSSVGKNNETNRIAWLKKSLAQIPSGSRILDAGAGEQKFRGLCSHLTYVAQDFALYDGKGNSKGLQTGRWDQANLDIISDISNIPEPDGSFDAIICIEVLEHLPDPIAAIREFYRLLRVDGILIITAPFCSLTHFAPYHFYSGFNRYFYEKNLQDNGFIIEEISENGNFFEYIAQELHRVSVISEKYAAMLPTRLERMAIHIVLKMLTRFSEKGSSSSDLLHYGCMVKATKRNC